MTQRPLDGRMLTFCECKGGAYLFTRSGGRRRRQRTDPVSRVECRGGAGENGGEVEPEAINVVLLHARLACQREPTAVL